MYCCCKNLKTNLGHVDVEISDIEQNTKNNEICSSNKLNTNTKNINTNNINNNINNKNNVNKIDNQNTIVSLNLNNINQKNNNNSNNFSNNYNKFNNENTINNNQINNNSSRNIFSQGKININNSKSDNYGYNSISNYPNGSMTIEDYKKYNQRESNRFNNNNFTFFKKNSILSKMTDNFSYRDDASNFNGLIYMLNNRNITDEEILSTPKLKIIGEPKDFFYGREILIDAAGIILEKEKILKSCNNACGNISSKILSNNNNINNFDIQTKSNSMRMISNENKGITFFGQNNINNNNRNFVPINYNREKFSDYNNIEIFFYIYYLRETKKYYLNPNANSIMFLKLNPKIPFPIKQGEFLSFDNTILIIKRNKSAFNNYLSIDYNQESFIFKDEDYINSNKYIKIGREKSCDIVIENRKSVSRINAIVKYNCKSEEWELYDGDENKKSLNGISILIRNQIEINDDNEIEFLGQKFKIQIINEIKNDIDN